MTNHQRQATDDFPWWKAQILTRKPVLIPDVAAMPPEAELEQRDFMAYGVRSLLCLPTIGGGDQLTGFIGFDMISDAQEWTAEQVGMLQLIANAIGGALERLQAQKSLQESQSLYESLVNLLPQNLYRIELDGRLAFVNNTLANSLQAAPDEIVGKTAYDFYPRELADRYRQDDLGVVQTGEPLH